MNDDEGEVCYMCIEMLHFHKLGWSMWQLSKNIGLSLRSMERHWYKHNTGGGEPFPASNLVTVTAAEAAAKRLTRAQVWQAERSRLISQAAKTLGMTHKEYRAQYGGGTVVAQRIIENGRVA